MMRLNLQLFAQKLYKANKTAEEYMTNLDGDFSYELGGGEEKPTKIPNHTGEASFTLLSDNGKQNTGGGTSIKGVQQSVADTMQSNFQASDGVTGAQADAKGYLGKVQSMASETDIVDQSTWDAINTPFQLPPAISEAFNYTQGLLQQLSSGRTSYTDQIKALMDDIQNREKFSYDVDSDTLFQQALASAMSSGKTAMQDTIGQASALTGGYGSTYATSAGNQAYNAYIQDAYNNLPEYYQMALEAYQMEGDEMYKQLGMLNDADATEYQRLYNAWSANSTNAQQMYQNSYGEWHDGVNIAVNSAGLQLDEHGQLFDQVYNAYTATANNAQQMYQNEYTAWADEVANAQKMANMMNSDYWSGAELTQRQTEHEADVAYRDKALQQDDEQFYASLGQDQSQFDASMAQENAQFQAKILADSGSGSGDSSLKEPSETQMSKALEAYNTGGMDALNQYINSLPSTVNKDLIAEYVGGYGNYDTADNPLSLTDRTWDVVNDGGWNGGWGIDNNAIIVDQYDNNISLGDLYDQLQEEGMSKSDAKAWIINLQKQLGI